MQVLIFLFSEGLHTNLPKKEKELALLYKIKEDL